MIEFKKGRHGLDRLITPLTEYGKSSVFQLDTPTDLRLGKNEIRIKVKPKYFQRNTEILIDIIDSSGTPVYYYTSKIANGDSSRSIIVHILESTAIGNCKLYFSGTNEQGNYYLYVTELVVNNELENSQIVKFETEPVIRYTGTTNSIRTFPNVSRATTRLGTNISMISNISPKQLNRDVLSIEKPELKSYEVRNEISGNIGNSKLVETPSYFQPSVAYSNNFVFSSSMKGGQIFVNGIHLEPPKNAANPSLFFSHSYSASILNVLNTSSIEVYPPFTKTFNYKTVDGLDAIASFNRFIDHGNFTASFNEISTLSESESTQSYAQLDLFNIEPIAGNLDSVLVSYKPLNVFGNDFQPIGTFKIQSVNLLVDSASVFFDGNLGLVETPIGVFRNGLGDFQNFWTTQSFGTGSIIVSKSNQIVDGVKITYPTTRSVDGEKITYPTTRSIADYVIFKPKSQYQQYLYENTEVLLQFDTFAESDFSENIAQIDVYISGSTIKNIKSNSEETLIQPINSSSFGNYIGSITQKFGALRQNKIEFISNKSSNILPIFVIRSGTWHFGNIHLNTKKEPGYSPNQSRIRVPLNDVMLNTELALRVDYQNNLGDKTDYHTLLNGVYFQGTTVPATNTFNDITIQEGDSYKQFLINSRNATANNFPTDVAVSFPLFKNSAGVAYTGSSNNVGFSFTINTTIYGVTGSVSNPMNTYVWNVISQGRASVNPMDNGGQPYLYNLIHISGSNVFTYGTYGPGGASSIGKTNLDSWASFRNTSIDVDGTFTMTYFLITTSSFFWNLYLTSTCEIQKYEHNF